ncbi:MAG: hypothetical protein LUD72_01580 [Bacteroidales bacterium]|nr:hypothetical protein [Bacteroidales bacterium]
MTLSETKQNLFNMVRMRLGAPVRDVELSEDQLCACLTQATEDYAAQAYNIVLEMMWPSVVGKQMDNIDWAWAMSVRSFDMMQDYSYYFSKEVGLQQRGPWELKKDFVKLEAGKQVYPIPSGRAINKVLWITPPTTDAAIWANYGGAMGVGFGGGVVGQMGLGAAAAFGGTGGAYGMGLGVWALPAYDISLMAMDLSYKRSLFKSELTYKVTAGPDGTHLIHLMSTPGSPFTFGMGGRGLLTLRDCVCWYTYYDTTPENIDDCRRDNPDVLLTPEQVPLKSMDYDLMNTPTQALVRQLMVGYAFETLAVIRGKFSGAINMMANQLQMDYNMLLTLGQRERENAAKAIADRMNLINPYEMMKKQSELVDNMLNIKKGIPLGIYVH